MLKPNDVYKKLEDNWVSRFILDEVVIMPLCRSEEDVQHIYSISNETGSRIWQLLNGKHSIQDIQKILKSEYQSQTEIMEREVLEFIKDLLEAKLIEKSGQKKSIVHSPQSTDEKKVWKSPEIAKVKMKPEQAVLSCCNVVGEWNKQYSGSTNMCAASCSTYAGGGLYCVTDNTYRWYLNSQNFAWS